MFYRVCGWIYYSPRVPIERSDRILILGNAFLHLSSNLSSWLSNGSVPVVEPNLKLHVFASEWSAYRHLPIQLVNMNWRQLDINTVINDITWIVLWDITHRVSENNVTSILLQLRQHIHRGGMICLKHTSPHYKERVSRIGFTDLLPYTLPSLETSLSNISLC